MKLRDLVRINNFKSEHLWPDMRLLLVKGDATDVGLTNVVLKQPVGGLTQVTMGSSDTSGLFIAPDAFVVPITPRGRHHHEGAITIGRAKDRDVCINHETVSKKHARFLPPEMTTNNQWKLVDDGSRNGTQVNNSRLSPGVSVSVTIGDTIRLGELRCVMLDNESLDHLVRYAEEFWHDTEYEDDLHHCATARVSRP